MECCLDRLAHVGKEEYREEEAAACSNRPAKARKWSQAIGGIRTGGRIRKGWRSKQINGAMRAPRGKCKENVDEGKHVREACWVEWM